MWELIGLSLSMCRWKRPLTTSDTCASGCAWLYALTSPVKTSAPSDLLYASVVRGCEPSGFTQYAARRTDDASQGSS